jgi:ABC-type amino acid transport substrate-binding protein
MKYLLYTEPYIKNPNVIVSSQENRYETIQALFGKTVAFPKGFYHEEVLTKSFPQIKRLPVENTLASLKAVSFGRADAALGEVAVIKALIKRNLLSGLRISGEVYIGDPELTNMRIAVRDDWPPLRSALMKAMAAVTPQEMNQIREKWLGDSDKQQVKGKLRADFRHRPPEMIIEGGRLLGPPVTPSNGESPLLKRALRVSGQGR